MLVCDGKDAVEMYLYDQEFSDGIFHVEWRFKPVENGRGFNSGVFVRSNAEGSIWHQAQVGECDRHAGCRWRHHLMSPAAFPARSIAS